MIAFTCPGCQQRLQVGDAAAGKKVKCPRCSRALHAPALVAAVAASDSPTLPPRPAPGGPTSAESAGPDTLGAGGGSAPDATEAGPGRPPAVCAAVPPELNGNPRYRVLALLGQGGMGAVYKAEHKRMERTVALKVVTPSRVESAAAVRRFHQEVKAAARLQHPNIVTAYDADQAGSLHFLVMEFVEGQSLAEYLRRKGSLPVAEACEYIRQAALGLQHAHEQAMVHRDIKPHNLMRTTQGQIKILDFGLARLAATDEAPAESQLTGAGAFMGTADYIAPEQANDAHRADIRADVYSLGCTLYQLLTGRVPFPEGSTLDKIIQHSVGEPARLETLRPDLPAGLALVVAKMMAKNPTQRYQTPAEIARALAPFAAPASATVIYAPLATPIPDRTEVVPGPRAMPGRRSPPVPPKPRRRGAGKWFIAAAVLVVLLAGAAIAAAVAVYRISTDEGDLVITPESPDVDVVVSQNGKQVEIVDTKTTKRVTLPSGSYDLSLKGDPDGLKLKSDKITVRRGDTVLATVVFLPKADPNLLVTAADGSGRFRSVKEALLEAKDGMTIRIKAGTYKEETLLVHNDVTLEGDGPAGSVVIETSRDTDLGFQSVAAHAVFRNLTIRAQAGNALRIDQGAAVVEDCSLTNLNADADESAVVSVTTDGKVRFLRCKVRGDPLGCGFRVLAKSDVTLEDCDVCDNAYQGVWAGEEAHVTLLKCRIHDGKRNGVFLDGKAHATFEDCEISGNGWNGVHCDDDSVAVVRKCRVNGNLVAGLSAVGRGAITYEACEMTANGNGPTHNEDDGKITETPPAKPKPDVPPAAGPRPQTQRK